MRWSAVLRLGANGKADLQFCLDHLGHRTIAPVSASPAARSPETGVERAFVISHAAMNGKIHSGPPGSCRKCR